MRAADYLISILDMHVSTVLVAFISEKWFYNFEEGEIRRGAIFVKVGMC